MTAVEDSLICLRIAAALSFFGSVSILLAYWKLPKLHTTMNMLIAAMSISDIGISVTLFFGNWGIVNNWGTPSCQAQGFFIYLMFISTMCWTACMATHVLLAVSSNRPLQNLNWVIKLYFVLSWGLPLVIAVVPFFLQKSLNRGLAYGPGTLYCSMAKEYSDWRLILFYGPVWLVFLYNLLVYIYVGFTLYQSSIKVISRNSRLKNTIRQYAVRTAIYLALYVFCWVVPTINRFYDLKNLPAPDAVMLLAAFTAPLQGFLNACVFWVLAILPVLNEEKPAKSTQNLEISVPPWSARKSNGTGENEW